MAVAPIILAASSVLTPLSPHLQPRAVEPQAVTAAPHPALWVVNDNDTIIYLFGTFHALDGRSNWFRQAVRTAFSGSDELMLETIVPEPVPAAPPPPPSGIGNLSPDGTRQVAQLAPSASFLATTKLVMSAGRAKGLSTDQGADAVLRDAAETVGKPVGGLESFEYQLRMFSTLPPPRAQAPAQHSREVQALGSVLSDLQAAWSRGDIERFAPMLRQMQAQSPQTYNQLFVQRNARWAQWIANRLKTPGTVFVAVGAGHLSGPDSLQNKLAMIGVKSARVN
jgi:uncharacterized protein YbaP (TraB family)